jgi:hypothetical protein
MNKVVNLSAGNSLLPLSRQFMYCKLYFTACLANVGENSRKVEGVNILPDDGLKEPKHVVK